MAKTFTPKISKRTQDAIVLCKMAEELNSRFAEFSDIYERSSIITDTENDILTVCNNIAIILAECISDDRRLDQ